MSTRKTDPNITVKIRRAIKPLVSMRAAQLGKGEIEYMSETLENEMQAAGVLETLRRLVREQTHAVRVEKE
jgi:hypothetical protein